MVSLNINPNILSQLQQNYDAKKEIATLLKGQLIRYSKKIWKKERIKIQKDLLQCLLPTLLEIITKEEEILKYLDLSEVSFDDMDVSYTNFKDSNANIDPQMVKGKKLYKANLQNCNMVGKDFTGVNIQGANLENTNAQINPQLIKEKSLYRTNVKGCTFINQSSTDSMKSKPADFTGVDIQYANLENTNAQIDPQLIENKSLEHANLKGLDLSHANFKGVAICGANLERTGAIINPHTVDYRNICGANLNYCTLIDNGKLEEITYNDYTSLKHVKFSTFDPRTKNIYQDITEHIQTACNPNTTLQKNPNKVFSPNILSILQNDSDAIKKITKLLKRNLIKYSKKRLTKERIKIEKNLLQCLLPTLLVITANNNEEILKYLDLSEASFAGMDVRNNNFKDSNANIDPQTVKDKSLFYTNLMGVDLSHANFNGVNIQYANLENTNAQIDPQLIINKSLHSANVKGCTFINQASPDSMKTEPADFTGVDIQYANLENTNTQIDPQLIKEQSLWHTNVKGCTFINKKASFNSIKRESADFTNVNIESANLENTNAQINPQLIKGKSLYHTNLKGLDLSHANFNGVDIEAANLAETGSIINPHTVDDKEISGTNLNYCTLIDNGNLEGIHYDKSTSLKHVNFSILNPQTENIFQDITEYIQTASTPITTLQKTLNKVFKR